MADVTSERERLAALEKLYKQEKYDEALEMAAEALEVHPESFQIRLLQSKIQRAAGDTARAEVTLDKLLATHPNHLSALLEMASLQDQVGQYARALEVYNQVLFIDPFNAQAKMAVEKINREGLADRPPPPEARAHEKAKETFRADTLPEDEIESILGVERKEGGRSADPVIINQGVESTLTEENPFTEDSIQVEDEDLSMIKPTIPGVDFAVHEPGEGDGDGFEEDLPRETAPPGAEEDDGLPAERPAPMEEINTDSDVTTEDVGDFFAEPASSSETEDAATRRPLSSEDEAVGPVPPAPDGGDFITESAAELYNSQGLYDEALYIYERLYQEERTEKYLGIIRDLKGKCLAQKKIQALSAFLRLIQERGE